MNTWQIAGALVLTAAALGAGCDGGGNGGDGGSDSASSATGGVKKCDAPDGCAPDEYCASFLWSCGSYGECKPRSGDCAPSIKPACACDGKVYDDECAARAAGFDLSGYGQTACPPPSGMFPCGYTFCNAGAEFCREIFEAGWVCRPLPAECQAAGADCMCFGFDADGQGTGQGEAAGCNQCSMVPAGGGFLLRCGPT
jgi:hypothetical protein